MNNIINLCDFLEDDSALDCETNLPDVEEIIEDREALLYLGEEAFEILRQGLSHRRQVIRLKCVVLIAELFSNSDSWAAFRSILLDRNESGDIRFHVARHCGGFPQSELISVISELRGSKGCNDRIVAAILMGWMDSHCFTFQLLQYLQDSNNCVVIAAFLTLLKGNRQSLLPVLMSMISKASPLQLKLLEKNLKYYAQCLFYQEVQDGLFQAIQHQKVWYLPQYFERPYSQEKLSKLDRPSVGESGLSEEQDLIFYEI